MRKPGTAFARPKSAVKPPLCDLRVCVDGTVWYARVGGGDGRRRTIAEPIRAPHLPLVLVHGFGISSSYFVPFAEALAANFDVYAPDLPGHGRSQAAPHRMDIVGFAEALRRWMSAANIPRASVIGHSMGCQVAVELAARHPDVVDRLVLIGPTADAKARSAVAMASRLMRGGIHEPAAMLVLIAKDYSRMLPRLRHELNALLEHRIEDRLPRISAPVLFVRGEQDKVAPQQWVEELARLVEDGRVCVIPQAAHAVHYDQPDEVARQLMPFLAG